MPGPPALYRPRFSVEPLAQAELIARQHQAPHAHVQRAHLAILLHKHPELDNAALAKELGQHSNWVYKWRRRWAQEGFGVEDKPGRGRKPVFSPSGAQRGQSHRL